MSVASRLVSPNVNYLKNVNWYRSQCTLKSMLKPTSAENLDILYKSKDYLIVDKPFDLIHYEFSSRSRNMPSLFELLRERFPFHYDLSIQGGFHVLHRLDASTSGCVCIPLSKRAQVDAVKAFSRNQVSKQYLALVYGHLKLDKETLEVKMPIGDDARQFSHAMCTLRDASGKVNEHCLNAQEAVSRIQVIEYGLYKKKKCTKVLINPLTGKRHQLRVHLSYLGHPVVGDLVYGVDDFDSYRTMLHSFKFEMTVEKNRPVKIHACAKDPFIKEIDPDWLPMKNAFDHES